MFIIRSNDIIEYYYFYLFQFTVSLWRHCCDSLPQSVMWCWLPCFPNKPVQTNVRLVSSHFELSCPFVNWLTSLDRQLQLLCIWMISHFLFFFVLVITNIIRICFPRQSWRRSLYARVSVTYSSTTSIYEYVNSTVTRQL